MKIEFFFEKLLEGTEVVIPIPNNELTRAMLQQNLDLLVRRMHMEVETEAILAAEKYQKRSKHSFIKLETEESKDLIK